VTCIYVVLDETHYLRLHPFALVAVRCVAAVGEDEDLGGAGELPLDRLHLSHRPVLVVLALG
jgi:hypothetical protein